MKIRAGDSVLVYGDEKRMTLKNNILSLLTRKTIEKNRIFKGLHEGESCYVFGNGASLKYYDLEMFSDRTSIGCNALFVHRDFKKLNIKYYYTGHPFFYYPYWINPYTNELVKNTLGALYKEKISRSKDVSYFMSVSNYFGINGSNINFSYHFNKPFTGFDGCKLDKEFTSMASGLAGMLGLAIYMGFKNITLVGCDYSFSPRSEGHFYQFGRFSDTYHEQPANEIFLRAASAVADVQTLVPTDNYTGHILPHISYKELIGDEPVYKENNEIVLKDDLSTLNSSGMPYQIFQKKRDR